MSSLPNNLRAASSSVSIVLACALLLPAGTRAAVTAGEFPVEGSLSDDGNTIVWRHAELPVGEGCAPVSISLGTWRRG